jgi:hypothetical protein
MSFNAQFAEAPLDEDPRGYEELAKGVYQIWRFCSHGRRGVVGERLAAEPAGVLLTLDSWTMLSPASYAWIFEEAARLADAEGEIASDDRIPVAISAIEDFEVALAKCPEAHLPAALRRAGAAKYRGWMLGNVLDREGHVGGGRPYPFSERLEEVLPWWRRTRALRPTAA